jgi:hypothetical protein
MTGRPLATDAELEPRRRQPPEAPAGAGGRGEMRGASGSNLLAGLWITASRWALDTRRAPRS